MDWVLETMFKFMLSQVTYTKSNFCNIFDPNKIMTIIKKLEEGSMNFRISFLKTPKLLHFLRPTSNLFCSIIVEWKNFGKNCA